MGSVRCIVLLSLCISAFAQVNTGRIVGTVFDPNHAAVPKAQVVVTQNATNERTTVETNAEGEYTATPLNPGIYTVRVSMQGFSTTVITSGGSIFREDNLKDLDFSIFKVFRVTENSRLQFRAEFFNLTNTTSFAAPGTNIDVASGGKITSDLSTPRQGQFALKYIF